MKYISQLLTAASGSVRGCTFTRGRGGAIIRGRAIPRNPASPTQTAVRAIHSSLIGAWTSTLTPDQRDAWTTFAMNTPRLDALGQAITITGQNAYVSLNTVKLQALRNRVDDPPITFVSAVLTPPIFTSLTESDGLYRYSIDPDDEWASSSQGSLLLFFSRPQNPSATSPRPSLRLQTVLHGSAFPIPAAHSSTLPFPTFDGQLIHVRFRAFTADGRLSAPQRSTAVMTA